MLFSKGGGSANHTVQLAGRLLKQTCSCRRRSGQVGGSGPLVVATARLSRAPSGPLMSNFLDFRRGCGRAAESGVEPTVTRR